MVSATLAVEEDESFDPGDIRFLGSPAVMTGTDCQTPRLKKLWVVLSHGLARLQHERYYLPPRLRRHL